MTAKGAVLCGGEGRRLRPLTNYFQKTMIPIGPRRKPLLEYVIRLLVYHNIDDITLLTGYRSEEIENYFGNGSRFGAKINYSQDPNDDSGSVVALLSAIESKKFGEFDDLLVYYGDVLSDLKIDELLSRHKSERAAVTLVVSDRYSMPVGVAKVENGIIKSFREKPVLNINVTTGCMVIAKNALHSLEKVSEKRGHKDLMSHFIPSVLKDGSKVAAYYMKGFWYDVGTTEAYERLDNSLIERHLKFLG
jgi:mannose-1-phosphate guanylyltransferase